MRFTFLFFCAFIRATFVATFVFCLHISAPTTVNLFCRCAVKADEASSNDTVFVLVPPSPPAYRFSLSSPCSTAVHVRRRLAFSSCVLIHILYRFVPQPAELEPSWVESYVRSREGLKVCHRLSLSFPLTPTQRVCGISACIKRSRHLFASML